MSTLSNNIKIFSFITQHLNTTTIFSRTACHELIIAYLKQTELTVTLTYLELMAFQSTARSQQGFVRMHPNIVFSHGSSGGVVAVYDPDGYVFWFLIPVWIRGIFSYCERLFIFAFLSS